MLQNVTTKLAKRANIYLLNSCYAIESHKPVGSRSLLFFIKMQNKRF